MQVNKAEMITSNDGDKSILWWSGRVVKWNVVISLDGCVIIRLLVSVNWTSASVQSDNEKPSNYEAVISVVKYFSVSVSFSTAFSVSVNFILCTHFYLKSTVCLMLGLMFGMHVVCFYSCIANFCFTVTASASVLHYIKPVWWHETEIQWKRKRT